MSLNKIIDIFKIKYEDIINELVPKIKDFVDNFKDYSDAISDALDNEDFKKILQNAGMAGSTINLAISFYEIVSSKSKDDAYYINKVALNVYKEVSKSIGIDLDKYKLDQKQERKFLENLFTKTNDQDFKGSSIYAHPIIVGLKNNLYAILKNQNEEYKWIDFELSFDVMLYKK